MCSAVGANSPLKSYEDLKTLSAQRPVKFSATGPEGTAYAATVIGTKLLGLRSQLITGYKSSADYVVAAIRGDSDAVIAGYPDSDAIRARQPDPRARELPQRGRCRRALRMRPRSASPISIRSASSAWSARRPDLPPEIQAILSNALAKAVIDPKVVAWAKENDVVMLPKTAPRPRRWSDSSALFFDKWKSFLATG